MSIEITIPRLGWSMDEGLFGEWLKRDGERVEAGDAIFTLEGDKALQDIESVDDGILHILPTGPQGGDTVRVGMLVGYLLAEGEAVPASSGGRGTELKSSLSPAEGAPTKSEASSGGEGWGEGRTTAPVSRAPHPDALPHVDVSAANQSRPVGEREVVVAGTSGTIPKRNSSDDLPDISPRAARVADELNVDWTQIKGSGQTGRIRERDVRELARSAGARTPSAAGNLRKTIARRMRESAKSTVPVTLTTRADATNLVALRNQFKSAQRDGATPSYQDIITKLTALALREHPQMNCRWEHDDIVTPDGIHIGLAVDTEWGLLVPVIRHVDRLSLGQLAGASRNLIERAQKRACSREELTGGTFTITNLGAFGIDAFTPVITVPETAILGLGAIRREAVVVEGDRIEARDQMTLSLTFDHCAVDGAPAARFLQRIVELVENPAPWLMSQVFLQQSS